MSPEQMLTERLRALLGEARVSADPALLAQVSWDALGESRIHPDKRPVVCPPLCVVTPRSVSEVRDVILFANREKVPIVPYGGGSGLMGGALSVRAGIVVDLKGMNRILAVNREALSARTEAGVVLEDLNAKLAELGLMLGHDPWTVPVATVGGTISTNSLGYRGARYGSMGEQVLGLEAVLPNGEVLRTRAVPKSSTGISLKHLLIGGEGCFGIITEATIRVFVTPEKRSLLAFRFPTFEEGFAAVQDIFAADMKPILLDLGDDPGKVQKGAVLYLGFEGNGEMVEVEERQALASCERRNGKRMEKEAAEALWEDRHVIAQQFKQNRQRRRIRPRDELSRDWIHVALPASNVLAFRRAAIEVVSRRGVRVQESGLWTRPEMFSLRLAVMVGSDDAEQRVLEDTLEELLRLVQDFGGSMEYCHGVGVKLAPLMEREHGYGLQVMRQIKNTLDPHAIMNPGKLGL
jgi:FAD/FMN-containing dehydrogenase